MKVGTRTPVIPFFDQQVAELDRKCRSKNSFSQYTNIEALLCILKNRELKLNSIRNVDDKTEKTYMQPLLDNDESIPYIACFDYSLKESIPLWTMYADNPYGVKICFQTEGARQFDKDLIDTTKPVKARRFGFPSELISQQMQQDDSLPYPKAYVHIQTKLVNYSDEIKDSAYQCPAKNLLNWATIGTLKSKDWEFQHEVRIIADINHVDWRFQDERVDVIDVPSFEYLLVPITFQRIKRISITFSPWMGKETKNMVRDYVDSLDFHKEGIKIQFRDSKFTDSIQRK